MAKQLSSCEWPCAYIWSVFSDSLQGCLKTWAHPLCSQVICNVVWRGCKRLLRNNTLTYLLRKGGAQQWSEITQRVCFLPTIALIQCGPRKRLIEHLMDFRIFILFWETSFYPNSTSSALAKTFL